MVLSVHNRNNEISYSIHTFSGSTLQTRYRRTDILTSKSGQLVRFCNLYGKPSVHIEKWTGGGKSTLFMKIS